MRPKDNALSFKVCPGGRTDRASLHWLNQPHGIPHSSFISVFLRRQPRVFAEEAVEVRGGVEAQLESDFLDRLACGEQPFLGVHDEHMVDEREGGVSRSAFHGSAEVGERDAA